jgi:uncharacterized protein (DUF1810 family)
VGVRTCGSSAATPSRSITPLTARQTARRFATRRCRHSARGAPDDAKLRSCATLFARVSPSGSVFERLLDRFVGGAADERTLRLVGTPEGAP